MCAKSVVTAVRWAVVGVCLDNGSQIGSGIIAVGGRGIGAGAAIVPGELAYALDMNGDPNHDAMGGVGVHLSYPHGRVHAVMWAAGDDIDRKFRISTQSANPFITEFARGSGSVWLRADGADEGHAAEVQLNAVEATAGALYKERIDVERHFLGIAGISLVNPTTRSSLTGPNGIRVCPCEMSNLTGPGSMPAGAYEFEWSGAAVDLALPLVGGVDVPLPPFGSG